MSLAFSEPFSVLDSPQFDYEFTDCELQELLGFLDSKNGESRDESVGMLANAQMPVSLQFQPHDDFTGNGASQQDRKHGVSQSPPLLSNGHSDANGSISLDSWTPEDGVCHNKLETGSPKGKSTPIGSTNVFAHCSEKHKAGEPASRSQPAICLGVRQCRASNKSAKEFKSAMSHSTIEKQRRDRINSLIDELRDLVPAQQCSGGNNEGDGKGVRPKHVVLADTIALVKDLQDKVRLGSQHAFEHNGGSSSPDISADTTSNSSSPAIKREATDSNELAYWSMGNSCVEARRQDCGRLLVKVQCGDRRGLLSDIINSFRSLPFEITRAAITTTVDGFVYDVFELDDCSGCCRMSEADVVGAVRSAICCSQSCERKDKKRRHD